MQDDAPESPYLIDKDAQGKLVAVRRRGPSTQPEASIPIDPENRDYCKFITWASEQPSPVAATFEQLEADSLYLGQEQDVIDYCKANALVL